MPRIWPIVFVFLLALTLLVASQIPPQFPDPDSFYHAKMALMIRDQGIIHEFPWLQFTSLKDTYINPHLLYHILLIPFVSVFDPLVGMKVSAVVFGMAALFVLWRCLQWIKAPAPWLFLLAVVLSSGFFHRLTLPRAPALAIALLLALTAAMLSKRHPLLFFGSAIFVWFYHGWPLLLPTLAAVLVAEWMTKSIAPSLELSSRGRWTVISTLGGIALGLILNPYFPQNLAFSVLDIFKIGVVNYQSVIPVGSEWYPSSPEDLFGTNAPILLLFGLVFALAIPGLVRRTSLPQKEETVQTFAFLLLAGGFVFLTFKSVRYMEYAIPFLALAAGALARLAWPFARDELLPLIRPWFEKARWRMTLPVVVAALTIASLAWNEAHWITPQTDYYARHQYEAAAGWIRANVPPGETIFHNSWDYSLILFYLDDTHYYLVGLDPTFMYDHDANAYRLWQRLSSGEEPDVSLIREKFGARTVIVDERVKGKEAFIEHLEDSRLFRLVEQNEWIRVYASL